MVSVLAPLAYVGFLFGSLWLFSKLYRKRQQTARLRLRVHVHLISHRLDASPSSPDKPAAEPWFPHHKSRDIYVSLLSLDPPPPRPILIAALLRRAMDDVKLIWSIRDAKTSLTTLLQRGQIGDELWERFLAAEKELEAEIVEVVGEANTFEPGYGQKIFGMASEMVSHERWKEVYEGIAKRREEENAKLASQSPAAPVLSPTSYLTPSSLTLAPSNPLPAAGTTPAPSTSLASPSTPTLSHPSTNAPLAPLPITSSPPSRDPTPAPDALASPTKSKAAAAPPQSEPAEQPASPNPSSPPTAVPSTPPPAAAAPKSDATPVQSPTTTPRKTPNKRGKKKPAVKGGR